MTTQQPSNPTEPTMTCHYCKTNPVDTTGRAGPTDACDDCLDELQKTGLAEAAARDQKR